MVLNLGWFGFILYISLAFWYISFPLLLVFIVLLVYSLGKIMNKSNDSTNQVEESEKKIFTNEDYGVIGDLFMKFIKKK